MKASIIWKKLVIDGHKIVRSEDIRKLAISINKSDDRSLFYLQEEGYIARIFRGIFYVKSPDEREKGYFGKSIYEIVAMGLEFKGVKKWYFGLETALKLNNLTHEYFDLNYVITDSYRTTKIIKIIDSNFQFIKRNKKYFKIGIINNNQLKYSDPERTILDLAYKRYLKSTEPNYFLSPINEYRSVIDQNKLDKYLMNYSKRFQNIFEANK